MNTTKKITLATIKSFIRKSGKVGLHISCRSSFDGMVDCVTSTGNKAFTPIIPIAYDNYGLGIQGAYFVGGSRNYFSAYDDGEFEGYEVSNCCGSFVLAVKKN